LQNILFAFEPSKCSKIVAGKVKSSYIFLVTSYLNVAVLVFLPHFDSNPKTVLFFFLNLDNTTCAVFWYPCMDNTESQFLNKFTNGVLLSSTAEGGAP